MDTEYDTTAVAGILSPLVATFDEAGLETLVQYRAEDRAQQRFEELAEKSSDGTLSAAEQREYDSIVHTSTVIAVLQAHAEKALQKTRNASR